MGRRWVSIVLAVLVAQVIGVASADEPERENDFVYTMDDGVRLLADRWIPYDRCPCPTVLTFSPYGTNEFEASVATTSLKREPFLQAGYAVVVVDVRGTGQSEGMWGVLNTRERKDLGDVVRRIAVEEWSDGSVVTAGISYGGITALMAAEEQDLPQLKAVFSLVPMADAYRDILSSGGSSDIEFLGAWSGGLVAGPSTVQPLITAQRNPEIAINAATAHAIQLATVIPVTTLGYNMGTDRDAVFGEGDPESLTAASGYDGEFYNLRSPLDRIGDVKVPVFIAGAELDIFQRSQPLLFNALNLPPGQKKLLMMPGYHVAEVPPGTVDDHGRPVPTLEELALAWFDRWARGIQNGIEDSPPVERWYYGADGYVAQRQDPPAAIQHERWYLDASAMPLGEGTLSRAAPTEDGSTNIVFQPTQGACSRNTIQYLYGAVPDIPCSTDNTVAEAEGITFTTPAFDEPYVVNGPISMRTWIRSSRPDANLVAILSDVAPDGSTVAYTYGAQLASLRALTTTPCATPVIDACSVKDGDEYVMPWHPFTKESISKLEPDITYEMWMEINPMSVVLQPGHRLRLTLKSSDFPHTVVNTSALRDVAGGVLQVLTGPETPTYLYAGFVPGGLQALKAEFTATAN
ncbi:MAG: CocE/NonD family hydrolase [Actinomycetota bacterium]